MMLKRLAALILFALLIFTLVPADSFTEDEDTMLLARVICAAAKDESYETKLAVGSLVMNRVSDPFFEDTLREVLFSSQQFPAGSGADEESLRAACEVVGGRRVLPENAVYMVLSGTKAPRQAYVLVKTVGSFEFYNM